MATQSKACNTVGGDGRLYRWPTLHLKWFRTATAAFSKSVRRVHCDSRWFTVIHGPDSSPFLFNFLTSERNTVFQRNLKHHRLAGMNIVGSMDFICRIRSAFQCHHKNNNLARKKRSGESSVFAVSWIQCMVAVAVTKTACDLLEFLAKFYADCLWLAAGSLLTW